jgi:hypothetical protein
MIRFAWFAAAAALALGCGRSKGVSDDQLGALVIEPKAPAKIDVGTAANEVGELSRALASQHATVLGAVGPHSMSIDTKTVVSEGGQPVSDLSDHAVLEMGAVFSGTLQNLMVLYPPCDSKTLAVSGYAQ